MFSRIFSTRLLVLGVVRFMQPVHGYDVRRELVSWRVEDSANVKAGSIYSALKTLEKDGLIEVTGRMRADGKPERTEYVLTPEGEKESTLLLREAWWRVKRPAEPLVAALLMMGNMPREELIGAVGSRIAQLRSKAEEIRYVHASIKDGDTGAAAPSPNTSGRCSTSCCPGRPARSSGRAHSSGTSRMAATPFPASRGIPNLAPSRIRAARGGLMFSQPRRHPGPASVRSW
jgi:DNA-binding PadR family transcriptional regulator